MSDKSNENNEKRLIYKEIETIVGTGMVLQNELISNHNSIKIGGPADYFITPDSQGSLKSILKYLKLKEIPFYIMGNGSNVFAHDYGFKGAIIQIYKHMGDIMVEGKVVTAGAGVLLSKLASKIAEAKLTGFEFAAGIPGTLGGAVFMNAGAYDGEMKDVLVEVEVIDYNGKISTIKGSDLELGYRTSI
jgi:UDP-N-acetylmuramate dehydrogenase